MITCTLLDILGRLINEHSDSYPISRLCIEDPISVSRKFSSNFHDLFKIAIYKRICAWGGRARLLEERVPNEGGSTLSCPSMD